MSENNQFEGYKKSLIADNETKYGKEIRRKYGDDAVEASNAKLMGLTTEQFEHTQALSSQINEQLRLASQQGDPSSQLAQQVCRLHKEWLSYYWSHYSKEAHLGLAQMYVDDPRFKAYYDQLGEGCAEFLRDALTIYCQ